MVKIIKEICTEEGISLMRFSYDWILRLNANNREMYIIGYKFPNNNSAIEHICNDKAALSDILSSHKLPHIEHTFFPAPSRNGCDEPQGIWNKLEEMLNQYGRIVCKPNIGSGGRNVYKVSSQKELEVAVFNIFSKTNTMAVSPYRDVRAEYRIIIVNFNVEVIYEKIRPMVIGNGKNTIHDLMRLGSINNGTEIDKEIDTTFIPALNEEITLSWRHNLGNGAIPKLVKDIVLREKLTALALSCALALDINFASIDIIESDYGLEVLEINSGVMMENFAKSTPSNYCIAKNIYRKAIFEYLKMDDPKYKYFIQRPRRGHFVLPILEEIAHSRNVEIIPDEEEGNFSIFVFNNGKRFIAKDYPFNINYAGSISLCTNKAACSSFLRHMGYSVPREKFFVKKSDIEVTFRELEHYFSMPSESLGFGFPMIIKPNSLSQGIGVYKIRNADEGMLAVRKILSLREKLFVLQEYCKGHDYRIVVLNNEVIQAYERIPFQIEGNGKDTIKTLLQNKIEAFRQERRDKEIDLNDSRIAKNILAQGYTMETVLALGRKCRLQDIANLSLGGTTEDKINQMSPFYRQLAVKIANSLNLKLCGIDIIAKDITELNDKRYYILEVNSAPGLDNYLYEGKKQDAYVKELYGKVFDYIEMI